MALQRNDGYKWTVYRRFSDFVSFQGQLKNILPQFQGKLPAKEFIRPMVSLMGLKSPEPSASFLSERRAGLDLYVKDLYRLAKNKPSFWNHPTVLTFFDIAAIVSESESGMDDLKCPVHMVEWDGQLQAVSHTLSEVEHSLKKFETGVPNDFYLKQISRQLKSTGGKIEKLQQSLDFFTTKQTSIQDDIVHSWSNRFQQVAAKHFQLSSHPGLSVKTSPRSVSGSGGATPAQLASKSGTNYVLSTSTLRDGASPAIAHTPIRSPSMGSRLPLTRKQSSSSMRGGTDSEQTFLEQQRIINQQDSQLSELSSIIKRHQELGMAINQELEEQNQLLDTLDTNLGSAQTKLGVANRRVKKL